MHQYKFNDMLILRKNKKKLELVLELDPVPLGGPDSRTGSRDSYRNRVWNQQNRSQVKIGFETGTVI